MSHPARPLSADLTHHVTAHAIPGRLCFPDADSRGCLLQLLGARLPELHVDLHAYAMMDTHLHLLLSARKAGALARAMLVLLSAHARLQNLALETRGPLWLDRYSSVVIQDESHLVNTCLYVEANPWRAFMVDHPADSQWTSYQANALDSGHRILTAHPVMAALGSDAQSWHQAYRDLMECYLKSACRFKSLTHAARTADPLAALRLCAVDVT